MTSMNREDAGWSLLKLNPRKQMNYLRLLDELLPDTESYYPVFTKLARPHGTRRAVEVVRPVYPGYVFIRVNWSDLVGRSRMHDVVSLPISAKWVMFAGKVEVVPDRVICRVKEMEKANELVREIRYESPYAPGVRVTVHLPVGDIGAIVVRLMGHARAIVDSPMCRITVPVHQLEVN